MTTKDWAELCAVLKEGNIDTGQMPEEVVDLHHHLAQNNGVDQEEALEWLARKFGILPFDPVRAKCSTRAEDAFRRLAPQAGDPETEKWIPFGTLGPLMLCAHYNPACTQLWDIPVELIIPVLIPQSKYAILQRDFLGRLEIQPLEAKSPLQFSKPLLKDGRPESALGWLLEEYPLENEIRSKLERAKGEIAGITVDALASIKTLPSQYGLALRYLSTGEACFNAEHATPQNLFPEALLEKHAVYPLHCGVKTVFLLSAEKENFGFEDEWLSGGNDPMVFRTVLGEKEAIIAAINRDRSRSVATSAAAEDQDLTYSDVANIVDIDVQEIQRINPSSINATPEQVVHWVLYRAITGRASDLHIEKYFNTARFRARIDGELKVIHSCPEEQLARFVSLIKNYSNMGQRRQDAQDGRFSLTLGKRRVDCRVSAIPCRKDLQKITIRFLDRQDGVRKLSELNLSPRQIATLGEAMGRDQGLILVTGPTGSGKTSTLYALLNSVNADNINIQTIEDPIEYEVEGLNQTQTDPINGIDFAEGLRRLMRADPDVILIGECRDQETANSAVNAALTGHLVLTTLHANDSLRAVSRLISMGIPPYLLADSLALSQAQRLVRRLCTYCKHPAPLTAEIRAIFDTNRVAIPPETQFIYEKHGCPECHEAGYTGRMALMEMCPSDNALADLISRNAPQSEMRKLAFKKGVRTLYQEGLQQVLNGNTSLEEISCLSYTAVDADWDKEVAG
ncbi:MAG: type II/IV secretion system protein [Chthoniobacterales bacterium]|nr:type II/IV secretion system protein [Chthoniobacterales bacterium]